jgi:hypothetical protein
MDFICVTPPKVLHVDPITCVASRHPIDLDVLSRNKVTSLGFDDEGGAAFGVRGDTVPHTYRGERLTVAFIGDLTNLNYLAIKGGVRGDKNPAHVIARVFASYGEGTVAKMRGTFAFVVYDSSSMRIFAARDPSGVWPLYQGVLEHQSLFVSTFQLVDYESMMEVPAGHYIGAAGQRGKTQRFSAPSADIQLQTDSSREAARKALGGLFRKPTWFTFPRAKGAGTAPVVADERFVAESAGDASAGTNTEDGSSKGKTRRGTRGGAGRRRNSRHSTTQPIEIVPHGNPEASPRCEEPPVHHDTPAEAPSFTPTVANSTLVPDANLDPEKPAAVLQLSKPIGRVASMPMLPSTPIPEPGKLGMGSSFVADAHRTIATLVRKFSQRSLSDLLHRSSSASHLSQLPHRRGDLPSSGLIRSQSSTGISPLVRVASLSQLPTH